MEMQDIFIGIIGILLGIVAFFLVRTMSRVDTTHDITMENKMNLALLKQESDLNYKHLSEKLDGLIHMVAEIKQSLKK